MATSASHSSSVAAAAAAAATSKLPTTANENLALWEYDWPQVDKWVRTTQTLFPKVTNSNEERIKKAAVGSQLLRNLQVSIQEILKQPIKKKKNVDEPVSKRQKTEDDEPPPIHDPYCIWVGQNEDPPKKEGAVLVQLTTAGLVNALAGRPIVDAKMTSALKKDAVVAYQLTYHQIRQHALSLHRVVQTKTEADFLSTTPYRIQQMLCPDVAPQEFKSIRSRVYETVVKGNGRNTGMPDEGEDVPVATRVSEHDIEKDKKCRNCGNRDQAEFTLDRKNGDIICTICGTVWMESLMHEGSQYRKFEGEADRNHHGDAPNHLYSNAHNMATTLSGVQFTSSAGGPGFGTQKKGIETVLRNTNAYTELNISQFGKGDRKTRIGYKDRQKKDAFVQMTHVGDALHLHEAVVQRAKELFAGFRNDRELVQAFKGVIAACLCLAFDQLSSEGLQIMRARQQLDSEALLSSRANRRNELHNASMAGKGGLLLDFSKVEAEKDTGKVSALEKKSASTWDLDDCRTWLLEASRNISQQWMRDRKEGKPNVPHGSQQELEGRLVEHTLTLCDQLETELRSDANNSNGRKRVVTPRVRDMARLGIRWQHAHERGSGGKGGVGNSGRAVTGIKPGEQGKRTAGQILILKTAKKLGTMLKNPVAGEAFHRELRSLIGRQEALKRKERHDAAAKQRFQQMKRKPWLQARANDTN